jgi:hypothetical protein
MLLEGQVHVVSVVVVTVVAAISNILAEWKTNYDDDDDDKTSIRIFAMQCDANHYCYLAKVCRFLYSFRIEGLSVSHDQQMYPKQDQKNRAEKEVLYLLPQYCNTT